MRALVLSVFLGILTATQALAGGDFTFKYGLGFGLPQQKGVAEVKLFEVGYQRPLTSVLHHKFGLGLWADTRTGDGKRKSAGYTSYSLGVRVEPGPFYLESYWGVALITGTDSLLSTLFEFTGDLAVGARDSKGRFLGVSYKHFSNAGIKNPNRGRDFFLVNVGFPVW